MVGHTGALPPAPSQQLRHLPPQESIAFLSDTIFQEEGGMEETDDGMGAISFYDALLTRLNERDFKLYG